MQQTDTTVPLQLDAEPAATRLRLLQPIGYLRLSGEEGRIRSCCQWIKVNQMVPQAICQSNGLSESPGTGYSFYTTVGLVRKGNHLGFRKKGVKKGKKTAMECHLLKTAGSMVKETDLFPLDTARQYLPAAHSGGMGQNDIKH